MASLSEILGEKLSREVGLTGQPIFEVVDFQPDNRTWEELSEHEQLSQIFSDVYKDVHGFRPRHIDTSEMTVEDLRAELDRLQVELNSQEALRQEEEAVSLKEFEALVSRTMEQGARDRKTALRWIMEGSDCQGDWDYLAYQHGLPYSFGRRLWEEMSA